MSKDKHSCVKSKAQPGGSVPPEHKAGINPRRNFLLKKATHLAKIREGSCRLSLFRLPDGRLLSLKKSSNPLIHDQLVPIEAYKAQEVFKVNF